MDQGNVVSLKARRFIDRGLQGLAKLGESANMSDDGPDVTQADRERCRRSEQILQFFAYSHLPEHLRDVSKSFGDLALHIVMTTPKNDERDACLRKLLEAKDCAVRAMVAK